MFHVFVLLTVYTRVLFCLFSIIHLTLPAMKTWQTVIWFYGGPEERRRRVRKREERKGKEGQRKERRGEEDNIVTESDNSRWLNAVDGRPARECISILLYKTVHAEQKQKKNETQTWGGQVDSLWISVSTCPLHLYSKGLICATTSITQQQQKRVCQLVRCSYKKHWNWKKKLRSFIPKLRLKSYFDRNI